MMLWKRRFCKTMVLHAEKDVKEKTAKILRVKLSQKTTRLMVLYRVVLRTHDTTKQTKMQRKM